MSLLAVWLLFFGGFILAIGGFTAGHPVLGVIGLVMLAVAGYGVWREIRTAE